MDTIRTMQDDLKKASQSPKDVAATFSSNLKNDSIASRITLPPKPASTPSPVPAMSVRPPQNNFNKVNAPTNLPFADAPKAPSMSPSPLAPKKVMEPVKAAAPIAPPKPPIPPSLKDSPLPKPEIVRAPLPPLPPKAPVPPVAPLVKPLPTEEVSASDDRRGLKLVLAGFAVLLIVAGGAFYYFWYLKGSNISIEPVGNEVPAVFDSLIPVSSTVDVSLSSGSNMSSEIKTQIESMSLEVGSFHRVVVYENGEPLAFTSFLSKLPIKINESVEPLLIDDYTLFVYKQAEGLRYGLAMGTAGDLVSAMTGWESQMFQDLSPLFISGNPQLSGAKFQDNKNHTFAIRYLNLPDPTTSLDYALMNNLLVVTTSKDSMVDLISGL